MTFEDRLNAIHEIHGDCDHSLLDEFVKELIMDSFKAIAAQSRLDVLNELLEFNDVLSCYCGHRIQELVDHATNTHPTKE